MFAGLVSRAWLARPAKRLDVLSTCAAILAVAVALLPLQLRSAAAKTPGTVHCYGGWCHRINTIDEMDGMVGRRGVLTASYYDDCRRDRFNTCGLTSSGAIFRPDQPDNAASPIFPDGTILLAYNPGTKLAVVVRVTSTGPYRGDRTLDVSRATAEHLGFARSGVATLEVAVLKSPREQDAQYKKFREYAPVPGFIGRFDTFDDASDVAIAKLRMETNSVAVARSDQPSEVISIDLFATADKANLSGATEEMAPLAPTEVVTLLDAIPAIGGAPTIKEIATDGLGDIIQVATVREFNLTPRIISRIAAWIDIAREKARVRQNSPTRVLRMEEFPQPAMTIAARTKLFILAARESAHFGATTNRRTSKYFAER